MATNPPGVARDEQNEFPAQCRRRGQLWRESRELCQLDLGYGIDDLDVNSAGTASK